MERKKKRLLKGSWGTKSFLATKLRLSGRGKSLEGWGELSSPSCSTHQEETWGLQSEEGLKRS